MTLMNIGLAKWDAMVVIPVFQSTWTMMSILSGAIVYAEFSAFNACPPHGDAICAGDFGTLRTLCETHCPQASQLILLFAAHNAQLAGLSWIFFFVGLVISIAGVFLLSKRKSNEQPAKEFAVGKRRGADKHGVHSAVSTDDGSSDSTDDESVVRTRGAGHS